MIIRVFFSSYWHKSFNKDWDGRCAAMLMEHWHSGELRLETRTRDLGLRLTSALRLSQWLSSATSSSSSKRPKRFLALVASQLRVRSASRIGGRPLKPR